MDLVTADWLRDHLADDDLRVADVRWYLLDPGAGAAAYAAGHIPGAVFVDVPTALAAREGPGRHPLPDPAAFAATMGALGIGSEHLVVAYDDAGGTIAARLWWMLQDLGHERVALLDGGIGAWVAAGGELTAAIQAWPPATLDVTATAWRRTIERDALRERLGSLTLLDVRAGERYRGEVEPIDPVAGHIPTALSAPTDGNLAADGRFLPPGELRARFEALGAGGPGTATAAAAAGSGDVVAACGSGINACHTILAMRLAGLPDPLLYPGSYSDWSRSSLPVATGPEPGELPASGAHPADRMIAPPTNPAAAPATPPTPPTTPTTQRTR